MVSGTNSLVCMVYNVSEPIKEWLSLLFGYMLYLEHT